MTTARAFRSYRFPAEVILWAVRWYLQFPISYRDLERMLADRGVKVDHTTMYRWVQRFAPELEKPMRRHLRPCHGHFEGRGWRGFHHHTSLCIAAYSFLVRERAQLFPGGPASDGLEAPALPGSFRPHG